MQVSRERQGSDPQRQVAKSRAVLRSKVCSLDAPKRGTWADKKQWKAALAELADANKLKYI